MTKFVYNQTKNASIKHTFFELSYSYHPHVIFEKEIEPCLKSRSANKQTKELEQFI